VRNFRAIFARLCNNCASFLSRSSPNFADVHHVHHAENMRRCLKTSLLWEYESVFNIKVPPAPRPLPQSPQPSITPFNTTQHRPFNTRKQVSGYLLTLAASLMITFVSFVVNQILADPCKLTNSVAGLSK
jgi:hypothetical protein